MSVLAIPSQPGWQQLISACFKGGWAIKMERAAQTGCSQHQPRWELPSLPSGSSTAALVCGSSLVSPTPTPCHASFHPQCHVQAEAGPGLTLPVPRHLTKPLALSLWLAVLLNTPTPAAADVAQLAKADSWAGCAEGHLHSDVFTFISCCETTSAP